MILVDGLRFGVRVGRAIMHCSWPTHVRWKATQSALAIVSRPVRRHVCLAPSFRACAVADHLNVTHADAGNYDVDDGGNYGDNRVCGHQVNASLQLSLYDQHAKYEHCAIGNRIGLIVLVSRAAVTATRGVPNLTI